MRADDVPSGLADRDCPDFGQPAWTVPVPGADRRVAIVSTAGLMQRGDRPFGFGSADYRVIDTESTGDLLMTHISTNFDRSGYVQDHEVVFPLERLRESADRGEIGAVARYHYSTLLFYRRSMPVQGGPRAIATSIHVTEPAL